MKSAKDIEIRTDYRIELLSLIAFLSKLDDKWTIDRSDNSFTKLLRDNFTKFVNHKAVVEFPKMWDKGLCWDAIPFLALHLDDNFSFIDKNTISKRLISRYDGDFDEVIRYLASIQDFAFITNFKQFYDSNINDKFIAEVNAKTQEYPIINILEKYLNLKLNDSTVIMSNLFISSFGITMETNKRKQIYCVISGYSLKVSQQHDAFDRLLLSIIWHEFLHSIINPLSDKLFKNPLEMTDNQVKWYCNLNESIIWAITFRLLLKEKVVVEKDGEWYFKNALNNGAPKANAMNILLIEHENDATKYDNFKDFYTILQEEFGNPPSE